MRITVVRNGKRLSYHHHDATLMRQRESYAGLRSALWNHAISMGAHQQEQAAQENNQTGRLRNTCSIWYVKVRVIIFLTLQKGEQDIRQDAITGRSVKQRRIEARHIVNQTKTV